MASRSLGTLTLDLVARVGGFTSGMTAAERAADKSLSAIEKRAYQFGQTLGKGLKVAGLAAVAGIGALSLAIKSSIDGIDELNRSAQQIGITTEELSKLAYAGELADVSLDSLTTALGRLTKAQAAALNTSSQQAKIFEALGIAVTKADGSLRRSTDVLGDFADVFKQLGGSPEAIAAGFQIFGKSFQELIPLLKEGREGIEAAGVELENFGGVITTEAGKNADEFNDNLTKLKVQFTSIINQIAVQLLPTLVELTANFGKIAKEGNLAANVVTLISTAVNVGIGAINFYNGAVDRASIAIGVFAESLGGLYEIQRNAATFGFAEGGILDGIKRVVGGVKEGQRQLDELAKRENATIADFSGVRSSASSTAKTPEEAAAAATEARLKKLLAALNTTKDAKEKNTKATKELTEAEKAWRDVMEVNEIVDEESRKAQEQIRKDRQDRADDFAALIGDIQTQNSLLGQTAEQQDLINTARQYGIDLASEEGRILTENLAAYHENRKAIEDQVAAMDSLRSSFTDFLTDVKDGKSVWDSLKSAVDSFADTLFQIAASNIAEQIFGAAGSNQGGSAGGGWAALLGSFFGGGRANGGPVEANGLYRVNERGPELLTVGNRDYLMMGGQSGSVTPNRGGGGLTQVNNFNYAAPYSAATEEQKNARLGFETKQALRRNGG